MQCWQQSQDPFESPFGDSKMEQPLDFSVKSPGSFGGSERDFCSPSHHLDQHHSVSRSSKSRGSNGSLVKDEQYWQRREKNNAAAKRSRDARRQKEEQTKRENQILRDENEKLKYTVRALEEHHMKCTKPALHFGLDDHARR